MRICQEDTHVIFRKRATVYRALLRNLSSCIFLVRNILQKITDHWYVYMCMRAYVYIQYESTHVSFERNVYVHFYVNVHTLQYVQVYIVYLYTRCICTHTQYTNDSWVLTNRCILCIHTHVAIRTHYTHIAHSSVPMSHLCTHTQYTHIALICVHIHNIHILLIHTHVAIRLCVHIRIHMLQHVYVYIHLHTYCSHIYTHMHTRNALICIYIYKHT